MQTFVIDFQPNVPKYQQLYNYIVEAIVSGKFKYQDKMPSKRKLSLDLKISQNTIITVYELLKSEGYLYSLERSGYYVSKVSQLTENKKPEFKEKTFKHLPKYNLTTAQIDSKIFPKAMWMRLTRNALCDESYVLGDNQGEYSLRLQISKYLLESRGIEADPENIIIGPGIEFLLPLILPFLPQPLGIENPGYKKISAILRNNHCPYHLINLSYDNINQAKTLYLTPSHQFPTGSILPIGKRLELINFLNQENYIIEDDYDSEYRFDGSQIKPLFSLTNKNVIYFSTFSRTISPAIRIAYMILPNDIMNRFKDSYQSYANPISRLEQQVLASFLENGSYLRHLRRASTLYKKKRDLIASIFKQSGIKISTSSVGLSMLVYLDKKINENALKKELLQNDILISFISEYYYHEIDESIIVLGFAAIDYDDIPHIIETLITKIKRHH